MSISDKKYCTQCDVLMYDGICMNCKITDRKYCMLCGEKLDTDKCICDACFQKENQLIFICSVCNKKAYPVSKDKCANCYQNNILLFNSVAKATNVGSLTIQENISVSPNSPFDI